MDGYRKILSIIAKRHPEIWDAINPHSLSDLVALNPQPLPPKEIGRRFDLASLNPQPLPPGPPDEMFGRHLVQMAYLADTLGLELRPLDEWSTYDDGELDTMGRPDPRLAAFLHWLRVHGWRWPWPPPPDPREGPQPDPWRTDVQQNLLAGIALGIASAGSFAESNRFLSVTMDGLAEAVAASELMSV